jgi:RNA polymerase sigma-70 factor (ECF subfamily)
VHGPALLGFVRRFVPDPARAEDVVQEIMLRVWRNVDGLDPARGDLRPYLFTVARNVLTDQWRAEQARPRLVGEEAALGAAWVQDEVDRVLESALIAEALQRLSAEHQSVVLELFFRGRSVAETATALGVPAGTVKSRSYYAVRALRAAFEEMGVTR